MRAIDTFIIVFWLTMHFLCYLISRKVRSRLQDICKKYSFMYSLSMSIHIVIVFFLFHSFTLPLLKYAKRTFRVCDVDEGEFNLQLKYIQDVYGEQYNVNML